MDGTLSKTLLTRTELRMLAARRVQLPLGQAMGR